MDGLKSKNNKSNSNNNNYYTFAFIYWLFWNSRPVIQSKMKKKKKMFWNWKIEIKLFKRIVFAYTQIYRHTYACMAMRLDVHKRRHIYVVAKTTTTTPPPQPPPPPLLLNSKRMAGKIKSLKNHKKINSETIWRPGMKLRPVIKRQ